MSTRDVKLLRDLAQQYLEICHQDVQQERRTLWRQQNSLIPTRPLIYVRAFAWREMPEATCTCEDPFFRRYEDFFRQSLFRATFEDDFIFEPWVTVNAAYIMPGEGIWGPKIERIPSPDAAREMGKRLSMPVYEAAVVGYPQRMRDYNARRSG